jgi:hypothetical protein
MMRVIAQIIERRLSLTRKRLGDGLLTWLTILLTVLTFVIVPRHASGLIVVQGYGFAIVLVMASYFLGTTASLGAVSIMLTGIGLAIAASAARLISYYQFAMHLDAAALIMVGMALAYVVARAVFGPGRITYHRINGAILLYLAIGEIFVGLFALIALLAPHAFSGLSLVDSPKLVSELIYFSFVTLTTTGYGDSGASARPQPS